MFLTQEMINLWGDRDINHSDVAIRNDFACIKMSHCSRKMCKIMCQKLKCVCNRGKWMCYKERSCVKCKSTKLRWKVWQRAFGRQRTWLLRLCKGVHCYLGVSIDENRHSILSKHSNLCISASGDGPFKGWASNWSEHYCTDSSSERKHTLLEKWAGLVRLEKLMKLLGPRKLRKISKPLTIVTVQAGNTVMARGNASSGELATGWAGSFREATSWVPSIMGWALRGAVLPESLTQLQVILCAG